MMLAGVGLSEERRSADAAEAAAAAAIQPLAGRRPDWCVAFVTGDHAGRMPALLSALANAAGTPYVSGCSAAGVMAGAREVEGGPAVAVLAVASDSLRGTPFLFHDDGDHGLTAGLRIGQRLSTSRGTEDLVLLWPDPHQIRPDRLLQGLDAALGPVSAAGGAASIAGTAEDTFQFSGTQLAVGAVAGLRLSGGFRYQVAVSQGCRPLCEPLLVTRSHENLILEIEGKPALDALREQVAADMTDASGLVGHLFVGLLPDWEAGDMRPGEYLVRNIVAADPDTGVVAIADVVEEGQRILIARREPAAARDELAAAVERVRPARTGIDYRFGLYFDCVARGRSLYGKENVDSALLAEGLPGVPLLGFFCNAELAPLRGVNHLFTYSGVLVLVGE
jgi:small ligand-binding sensory domain FIST